MNQEEQVPGDEQSFPPLQSLSRYKVRLRPVGWRAVGSRLRDALWQGWTRAKRFVESVALSVREQDTPAEEATGEIGADTTLRRYKVHLRPIAQPPFWTKPRRLLAGGVLGGMLIVGGASFALRQTSAPVVTPTPMRLPTHVQVARLRRTATSTVIVKLTRTATATPLPIATASVPKTWTVQPYPYRLVIPAIGLDAAVVPVSWIVKEVNGELISEWEVAAYAGGWHSNSAKPGQGGNIVIAGHHNIDGEVFRYVVNLEQGQEIILYSGDKKYAYVVEEKIKLPAKGISEEQRRKDARYIEPTPDEQLTLVTCWPYYGNTHRIVVVAKPAAE